MFKQKTVSVTKDLLANGMSVYRDVIIDSFGDVAFKVVRDVVKVDVSAVGNVVVVHDEAVDAELEGDDVGVRLVPRFRRRNFAIFANRHLRNKNV